MKTQIAEMQLERVSISLPKILFLTLPSVKHGAHLHIKIHRLEIISEHNCQEAIVVCRFMFSYKNVIFMVVSDDVIVTTGNIIIGADR